MPDRQAEIPWVRSIDMPVNRKRSDQRQHSRPLGPVVSIMSRGLMLVLLATGLGSRPASAEAVPTHSIAAPEDETAPSSTALTSAPKRADFKLESASPEARHMADWIVGSGDNLGMPFVIVDKVDARVFVFDAAGLLRGAAPALLGLALGDETIPGIGDRELSSIRPEERTTPAGRFVAAQGRNSQGKDIIWVDYDAGISMHRVITTNPREHRLQRLTTLTPLDNRITYGCINIPVKFYEKLVRPAFAGTNGIVYILPETRSARKIFTGRDIEERPPP